MSSFDQDLNPCTLWVYICTVFRRSTVPARYQVVSSFISLIYSPKILGMYTFFSFGGRGIILNLSLTIPCSFDCMKLYFRSRHGHWARLPITRPNLAWHGPLATVMDRARHGTYKGAKQGLRFCSPGLA